MWFTACTLYNISQIIKYFKLDSKLKHTHILLLKAMLKKKKKILSKVLVFISADLCKNNLTGVLVSFL